ncbi:hypothetical protein [Pseudalkalibacillus hwajinpoensis]|uniref:hypothetical protein n=1 Tax=Guptibacillus hwajinpoensis TaxID=208199 RepID=UPI001CD4AE47|nr:hypothetical protein [Pseudalkalibacillus hwajinpoensis]MCA0992233.1 hypothetical protein [Pseudalkalibacillus hwajinpoensis]
MEIWTAVVIMIGLILVRVIGFFYPSYLEIKGKPLTEGQKYVIDTIAIGVLLFTFIIVWTL